MADAVERETKRCRADDRASKFRDAAMVLVEDASFGAASLRKLIRSGEYEQAEAVAARLQQAARDAKWLLRRLPKKD